MIKTDLALAKRIYAKEYRESDPAVVDKVVTVYAGLFKAIPTVPASGLRDRHSRTSGAQAISERCIPSTGFLQR